MLFKNTHSTGKMPTIPMSITSTNHCDNVTSSRLLLLSSYLLDDFVPSKHEVIVGRGKWAGALWVVKSILQTVRVVHAKHQNMILKNLAFTVAITLFCCSSSQAKKSITRTLVGSITTMMTGRTRKYLSSLFILLVCTNVFEYY